LEPWLRLEFNFCPSSGGGVPLPPEDDIPDMTEDVDPELVEAFFESLFLLPERFFRFCIGDKDEGGVMPDS